MPHPRPSPSPAPPASCRADAPGSPSNPVASNSLSPLESFTSCPRPSPSRAPPASSYAEALFGPSHSRFSDDLSPARSAKVVSKPPLPPVVAERGSRRILVTDDLFRTQLDLSAQVQTAEAKSARIAAENALLDAADDSVAPPAPLRGSLHMDPAGIKFFQSFLLHHFYEPKSRYANLPEVLPEQLRGLLSGSAQCALKDRADSARL